MKEFAKFMKIKLITISLILITIHTSLAASCVLAPQSIRGKSNEVSFGNAMYDYVLKTTGKLFEIGSESDALLYFANLKREFETKGETFSYKILHSDLEAFLVMEFLGILLAIANGEEAFSAGDVSIDTIRMEDLIVIFEAAIQNDAVEISDRYLKKRQSFGENLTVELNKQLMVDILLQSNFISFLSDYFEWVRSGPVKTNEELITVFSITHLMYENVFQHWEDIASQHTIEGAFVFFHFSGDGDLNDSWGRFSVVTGSSMAHGVQSATTKLIDGGLRGDGTNQGVSLSERVPNYISQLFNAEFSIMSGEEGAIVVSDLEALSTKYSYFSLSEESSQSGTAATLTLHPFSRLFEDSILTQPRISVGSRSA